MPWRFPRNWVLGLEKGLRTKAEEGWVKISDKVAGLADWIGSDSAVLQSTIDEYNTSCDQGYDPLFAKDRKYLLPLRIPPYYAIRANSDLLDTIGGIRINEHMEVLDEKDRPIPGLYAAGVVAGGWEADSYCDILSGAASSFAVNSGRIAAEHAAEFISSKG
jgi:fumarate reductase flavoprotein subunit